MAKRMYDHELSLYIVYLVFPVSNAVFVHVLVQMVEDRLQEKRISFTLMGGKYKPDIALFGQWSFSNRPCLFYRARYSVFRGLTII